MKFEIIVKHSVENTHKAIDTIDNLTNMAISRGFDMKEEFSIYSCVSKTETMEMYPNLFLDIDEVYPQNGRDFHADYLENYANDKGLLVDLLNIVQ